MSTLEERLAASEEDEFDAIWRAKGAEAGVDVLGLDEIRAVEQAANGLDDSARARPSTSKPEPFRRPTPIRPPHWDDEDKASAQRAEKPKRKEIHKNKDVELIDIVDDQTGEVTVISLRRVPSTELPYLDRLDMVLSQVRAKLARNPGRTRSERTKLDQDAAEYNATMEEMVLYCVDMPQGFYRELDTAALSALQDEIREMVRSVRGGSSDPN